MRAINYHPSQLQWAPVSDLDKEDNTGEILRMGQLVSSENIGNSGTPTSSFGTGGVSNHYSAAGIANTTEETRIAGIVVATNNQTRVLSSLANYVGIEQITATVTSATQIARASSQSGGHWPQDDVAMVQFVRLTPYTKVRVNLYATTRGTAPALNTATAVTGTTTFTADAHDHGTPVAGLGTSYCRSGLNKGRMRQTTDTSDVTKTFGSAWRSALAIGDTFVTVPVRPFGISYVQLDVEADFFDISVSPASNYMHFDVHELHLEKAGEEYVIGTFAPEHFLGIRA